MEPRLYQIAALGLVALLACATHPPELESLISREQYLRATIEYADYAVAWAHYGEQLRFEKNQPAKAEAAFLRAIAAPKSDSRSVAFAWRGLGEIARERNDIEGALACFEKSLSIRPLADTHRSLSALYATEKSDFARAADHAKAAVSLDPEDPIALLQWAVQALRAGRTPEAEAAYVKALRINPNHCCVLYNAACYHSVRGDRKAALEKLDAFFATPHHRHITREEILKDPDFAPLAADSEFRALLDRNFPK
jgi:tetratricopeptide (TPR) repeat protein